MTFRRYRMAYPNSHASSQSNAMSGGPWIPPTDVYEMPTGLVVKVELAGVPEESINITLDQNRLIINGKRPDDCAAGGEQVYHHASIRYGEFRVEIQLPMPVDTEHVEARYERGFLYINLPKATPRKLRVNVEPQQGQTQPSHVQVEGSKEHDRS